MIRELIYNADLDGEYAKRNQATFLGDINGLISSAFSTDMSVHSEGALLQIQQVLYEINIAHLSVAWINKAKNIHHPFISSVKYTIDRAWQAAEKKKYQSTLTNLPTVASFPTWIRKIVAQHKSNELHPVFTFLRDEATLEQFKEFLFQETPLEMLFGDIIAFMLPGVYGSIKVEFVKNYWDEVGRAVDAKVHRQLRARIMATLGMDENCYINNTKLFVREELQLINMYLSMGLDRTRHTELSGALLATELMIPGRFQYLIDGFRRLGLSDHDLHYHIEHTSVDEVHADDLLDHVAIPILQHDATQMSDLVLGALRRLDTIVEVLDCLHNRMLNNQNSYSKLAKN